jgi:hypothetical protein
MKTILVALATVFRSLIESLLLAFGGLANSEAGYIEFGIGGMFANPNAGNEVAVGSGGGPVQFGIIQNVELDISQALKELMGQNKFPDDVAPSDMKVTGKGGFARLNIPIMNNLFYADSVASGGSIVVPNEAHTLSGTTVVIAPPNSGTFAQDLGVVYASNFKPLELVTSGVAQGQYEVDVSTATYTINAADENTALLFSYRYTVTTGNTLTVTNHVQGYGPVFELFLLEHYNGLNGLHLYACRASKLSHPLKRADYMIPEFDFTGYANPAGNVMDFYDDGTGLGG